MESSEAGGVVAGVLQTVTKDQILRPPNNAPSPPPLEPTFAPLWFFLGLLAAYAVVMVLVLCSFYVKTGTPSEELPLQQNVAKTFAAREKKPRYGQYAWSEADPQLQAQLAMIDGWTRAAFIRKVYAILSTQLLITVGIIIGLIYAAFDSGDPHHPTEFGYYIAGPGYYLSFVSIIVSLCFLCALMGCKNNYPLNFIGLLIFTGLISFSIGMICVVYYGAGFGQELVLAFVITCSTFIALTLFTIFSKIDFEFLGPFLCMGIFLLMIWSVIMSLAFTIGGFSAGWEMAFVIVGIIIFVGFIIYDTYMIVTRLGVDDYIIAAIELYLDVVNFFLFVLQLLVLCGGGRN